MRARYFLPSTLALLMLPAFANGQSTVWVSAGKDILQVTTSNGGSKSVHSSGGTSVGHMVYGPDARIYFAEFFADQSCISRVNPTGSVAKMTGLNATYVKVSCSTAVAKQPRELRFDSTGALLYATSAAGVQKISAAALAGTLPVTPVALIASTAVGSGLDHAPDGAVLYTGGDAINRAPSASGFPVPVTTPVGLDVVTGGLASVFPSLPTGAICASSLNALPCFDKEGSPLGALHTFAATDKPQGWGFTKNDTAWVATSVDPTQTITGRNGVLWRIDDTGATTVYPSKFTGKQPPFIGVALPPTTKSLSDAAATDIHTYVVGSDVLSITTPVPCRLAVTVMERLPSDVQSCLSSTGLSLEWVAYLGETFVTEYVVTELSGAGSCFTADQQATQLITAFFPWPANLASVRRPPGAPKGSNTCVSNTIANYALAAPNDAGTRGGSNSFSGFMGAQVTQAAQAVTLQLLPPLAGAPFVTTDPTADQIAAAVEQNTGNVAVKFTLTNGSGSLVTTPNAVFSVQRLGSSGAFCNVQPQDAVTGPPKFFITADNTHRFNLDTSEITPFECTQPGLYAFGISFPIDGVAAPVTFLVELK